MPTNAKRRRRFESRSNRTVAKQGQRARPRRLGLEALEARQMLSASPTLVTTVSFAAGNVVGNALFRKTRRCSPAAIRRAACLRSR